MIDNPKPNVVAYIGTQKRYWVRSIGVALAVVITYLLASANGQLPDIYTLYMAGLQFGAAFLSSMGLTAATQPKE